MSTARLRLLNCVVTLLSQDRQVIDDVYGIFVREDYYHFNVTGKPQVKVKVEDVVFMSIIPKEMERKKRKFI